MDNEVGDRLRKQRTNGPDVPTISDDDELFEDLAENSDAVERNVDDVDVDESGTPVKISNGEDG